MAALQRVASTVSTAGSGFGSCKGRPDVAAEAVPNQFPAGLHVLVVDDDITCLKIVDQMLRLCLYRVTTCHQATVALNLLREKKGFFDLVLSDVHMPDMDGYKLLEHVGLEMDLPVIMMSADGRTSAVMKGVRHGACDYLIKPIREEELKNIWQHVVRKKWIENKDHEHSGSLEENDWHKWGNDDLEYASSVNEGTEGAVRSQKKRNNVKEDEDDEQDNDDPSTSKKPRVVWSVELHQQFVSAVNQLGIDKAVPKRILELMNVPGLTRENVASHLQKFRLYLKRISGVAQQSGIPNAYCGSLDSSMKLNQLGRLDIQALAATGHIPSQTLAVLHAELLGRPMGLVSAADQQSLLQASMQSPRCISVEHCVAFGQPLVKCESNMPKNFSQGIASVEEITSGFGAWPSTTHGVVGPSGNIGGVSYQNSNVSYQNSNVLMDMVPQQQQHQPQKQQQPPLLQSPQMEINRSINVQPSCLVVPSHSASFQAGNSPASVKQNSNRTVVIDYNLLSQPNNSSLNVVSMSDRNIKSTSLVSGHSGPCSVSPSLSPCFVNVDTPIQPVQNSTMTFGSARQLPGHGPTAGGVQGSYVTKPSEVLDQGVLKSLGFVGKGTCIPSRFAVDEFDIQTDSFSPGKPCLENRGNKVKQEPDMEVVGNARVGFPVLQHFTSKGPMSVFTD